MISDRLIPKDLCQTVNKDANTIYNYATNKEDCNIEKVALAALRLIMVANMSAAALLAVSALMSPSLLGLAYAVGVYVICHDVFVTARNYSYPFNLDNEIIKEANKGILLCQDKLGIKNYLITRGTFLEPIMNEIVRSTLRILNG
jgi:hypothetical protein